MSRAAPIAKAPAPPVRSGWGALAFVSDLPNAMTLTGLACGVLGIYFAVLGSFAAAMIAMLWATFFDWFDGPVARRMKTRTEATRAFGAQLDTLVDLVSHVVCPALLLLSLGDFGPWFIPGALGLIAAGVLRLSYFNAFGLEDASTYLGVPVDHNSIVLALLFVFETSMSRSVFAVVVYVAVATLAVSNILPFRMPKVGGRWYVALALYVFVLTGVYAWRLWAPVS